MHCIALAFSQYFIHLDVCLFIENCVLLGLDWVEPIMQFLLACHMLMHISCIFHAYVPFHFPLCTLLWLCGLSSLSLSRIDCVWHPSINLLQLETLFVSGHHLLLILSFPFFTFGSVMRRPIRTSLRTFLNVAFIQNAMWFYWTFLTFLFLMSFILGDGNLFVRYPWGVPPCSYKNFTPTCTILIPLCHSLSRHSEVHVSQSLRILYPRYYMSQGYHILIIPFVSV